MLELLYKNIIPMYVVIYLLQEHSYNKLNNYNIIQKNKLNTQHP